MPIKVPCTCGARLNVPDNLAGKRVRCPQCKSVHQVPDASAFQQVPGPKPAQDFSPAEATPAKKGISLKGKGAAAGHSGRVSEPTMVMSASELKEAIAPKEDEAPPMEEPAPPAEELPPADDDRIPAAEFKETHDTRVRRLDAKSQLKKIKDELVHQKDEAGTRYIPPSAGLAKTRNAEPTMVMTKEQFKALQEAEEVSDKPPANEEPAAPVSEPQPPLPEPASTVELPRDRPKSDARPEAAPAPSRTPTLGLLFVAALCFFSVVVFLAYSFVPKLPFGRYAGYGTVAMTGLAGLVALALAFRK